jgi:hypothetical protein
MNCGNALALEGRNRLIQQVILIISGIIDPRLYD